jgi:hypothetical protein
MTDFSSNMDFEVVISKSGDGPAKNCRGGLLLASSDEIHSKYVNKPGIFSIDLDGGGSVQKRVLFRFVLTKDEVDYFNSLPSGMRMMRVTCDSQVSETIRLPFS